MRRLALVVLEFSLTTFAYAATINVTTILSQIADTGTCSLREVIIAANTNAPSGANAGECSSGSSAEVDTIAVPAGAYLLICTGPEDPSELLDSIGDLEVTENSTIIGAGRDQTIFGGAALGARALQVSIDDGTFAASKLTIRNGSQPSGHGGGVDSLPQHPWSCLICDCVETRQLAAEEPTSTTASSMHSA